MAGSEDFLCKALELAEKSREVFEQSLGDCGDPMAREAFEHLLDQGRAHEELIGQVYDSIRAGKSWAGSCSLEENSDDVEGLVRFLAEKHVHPGSCPTEVDLVDQAMEAQAAAIDFYDQWSEDAEDDVEVLFVERMASELRGQHMILADLKYYFDDPEGWALQQDNPVLDGA